VTRRGRSNGRLDVNAPLMRPWQNALAIVAAFFVAGALLPWRLRLVCALAAIAIVLYLAVLRWRAHMAAGSKRRIDDVYGRIEALRAAREKPKRGRR
jgi:hypothetical protein